MNKVNMPKRTSAKKGKSKYSFSEMEVGDSFIIEENKRYSVITLAKKYGESCNPERTFSTRKMEDGKIGCWRTK